MPKKYYFGFEDVKYGNTVVPVSNLEKTLIDLFYYRRRLSLRDYSDILKIVKIRVLATYLKRYDGRTRKVVLAFVGRYKPLADSGKLGNMH
jgi:predicted RNA-binding protein